MNLIYPLVSFRSGKVIDSLLWVDFIEVVTATGGLFIFFYHGVELADGSGEHVVGVFGAVTVADELNQVFYWPVFERDICRLSAEILVNHGGGRVEFARDGKVVVPNLDRFKVFVDVGGDGKICCNTCLCEKDISAFLSE